MVFKKRLSVLSRTRKSHSNISIPSTTTEETQSSIRTESTARSSLTTGAEYPQVSSPYPPTIQYSQSSQYPHTSHSKETSQYPQTSQQTSQYHQTNGYPQTSQSPPITQHPSSSQYPSSTQYAPNTGYVPTGPINPPAATLFPPTTTQPLNRSPDPRMVTSASAQRHPNIVRSRIKPEKLRDLRELIRKRYALDVEIWEKKDIVYGSRSVVQELMDRSDATLREIEDIILDFDSRECFDSEMDHRKFQRIKDLIFQSGKRDWNQDPPWQNNGPIDADMEADYFNDDFFDGI
jgi:hypothetical protein